MTPKILTQRDYWTALQNTTKSYWRQLAERSPNGVIVCTHRPNIRYYRGDQLVRRCSHGRTLKKASDVVGLSLEKLLNDGYILIQP